MKNKKIIIISAVIGVLLLGGIVYLSISLQQQKQANRDMQELAELDKKEMENEYQQFAMRHVDDAHQAVGDRQTERAEQQDAAERQAGEDAAEILGTRQSCVDRLDR